MEPQSVQHIVRQYTDLLKRGKYFVIIPVIVSVIVGSAVAFKLPPVYRSEVKLYYMQAQVPEWLQLQTINIYLEAALVFIEASAFSRNNCLKIINELNLYPDLIDKVPEDDLIALMKENYDQEPTYTSIAGKGGRTEEVITGFEFSFDHNEPEKAFQAANILATSFVGHYKKFRESFAAKTSSFFEDERQRLRDEIAEIDLKISEFKEKNVNYLPELFQLNYRMLENFEEKLFNLEQEIRLLRGQRNNLELSLAAINPLVSMEGISGQKIVTPEEKLAALKSELGILLATYSEKYPDVIRARMEIKALEKIVSEKAKNRDRNKNEDGEENSRTKKFLKEEFEGIYNPAYINLVTQIEHLNLEIEKLEREKKEFEKDLFKYQMRVGKTPLVEKEYRVLNRDLDSAQARYNQLVSQALTLESAAAMEKREMGGRLTIGQPPTFPLRPVKPNRPLIIAGAFVLGTGLGVLILLGWEFLTRTVRTPQDISKFTEIPVLSEIPEYQHLSQREKEGKGFF